MPNYYSAADVFISGSHYEGSGYALIEAMSAGLVPIVTDIPSFRSIAGDCGERWQPGDARRIRVGGATGGLHRSRPTSAPASAHSTIACCGGRRLRDEPLRITNR